jgi:AcrR family transcriptional regulator
MLHGDLSLTDLQCFQVVHVARNNIKVRKRPPASPRERLLRAATDLFCRYGINSIGVDAIVAKAGTAKATLYNTFGSKDALACEVLDREGEKWRAWLFARLEAYDGEPVGRLLHIFELLEDWFSDRAYFGCPFINAVAESDKLDDKLRKIALGHKLVVVERIVQMAREAGAKDAEKLAHELAVIIDGSIVAAMVTKDARQASVARNVAATIIAAQTLPGRLTSSAGMAIG